MSDKSITISIVFKELEISYTRALTSLSGLDNITSVGAYLRIGDNDALTSLCALYNVNLSGDNLYIFNHTSLSMATAYALETRLRSNGFTGIADIYNNTGFGLVSCDIDDDIADDGVLNDFD